MFGYLKFFKIFKVKDILFNNICMWVDLRSVLVIKCFILIEIDIILRLFDYI